MPADADDRDAPDRDSDSDGEAEGEGEGDGQVGADGPGPDRVSGAVPPRGGWFGAQMRGQVDEPTHVLAPVLALVTFWSLSVPGWHLQVTRLCLAGWFVLGVLCAIGIVRRSRGSTALAVPLWKLMVVPVLAVMVTAAAMTETPVRFRFQFAKAEMTVAARTYLTDLSAPLPETIGPFPLDQVTRRGRAVYYVVGGGGSDDQYGFVYQADGVPEETGRDRFTHLDEGWYLWYSNSPRLLFR